MAWEDLEFATNLIAKLRLLTQEQRNNVFAEVKQRFCMYCGKETYSTCHCENDE